MHKLFVIIAATTGYARIIAGTMIFLLVLLSLMFGTWLYFDYKEVSLRNKVFAQQEIAKMKYESESFLAEQQKLIDYKMDYDNLRESWLSSLLLSTRPPINIKLIISQRTHDAYK